MYQTNNNNYQCTSKQLEEVLIANSLRQYDLVKTVKLYAYASTSLALIKEEIINLAKDKSVICQMSTQPVIELFAVPKQLNNKKVKVHIIAGFQTMHDLNSKSKTKKSSKDIFGTITGDVTVSMQYQIDKIRIENTDPSAESTLSLSSSTSSSLNARINQNAKNIKSMRFDLISLQKSIQLLKVEVEKQLNYLWQVLDVEPRKEKSNKDNSKNRKKAKNKRDSFLPYDEAQLGEKLNMKNLKLVTISGRGCLCQFEATSQVMNWSNSKAFTTKVKTTCKIKHKFVCSLFLFLFVIIINRLFHFQMHVN